MFKVGDKIPNHKRLAEGRALRSPHADETKPQKRAKRRKKATDNDADDMKGKNSAKVPKKRKGARSKKGSARC